MENFPEKLKKEFIPHQTKDFEEFRGLMKELKTTAEDPHWVGKKSLNLKGIDPDKLTLSDMKMWNEYLEFLENKDKVTKEEINSYFKEFSGEGEWVEEIDKEEDKEVKESRELFHAWLANKVSAPLLEAEKKLLKK